MDHKISVGCISYFHQESQIMHMVSSWLCQRDGRFDFTLIHDGPHPHMEDWLKKYSLGDPRFSYYAPPERTIDRLIRERPEDFKDPSLKHHGFEHKCLLKK